MRGWLGLLIGGIGAAAFLGYAVTQETPVGEVRGLVVMKENGRPLPEAEVTLEDVSADTKVDVKPRHVETKEDGTFTVRNLPTGHYFVTVYSSHHAGAKSIVHVEEGQPTKFEVEVDPNEPELELRAPQRVFLPGESMRLTARGFVPESTLRLTTWRLKPEVLLSNRGIDATARSAFSRDDRNKPADPVATKETSFEQALKSRDVEGVFVEPITVPPLREGVYCITAEAGGKSATTVVYVSSIALVTKVDDKLVHCFVTDMRTGKPIVGAELLRSAEDKKVVAGKTGPDGTGVVPNDGDRAAVLARVGDKYAITDFYSSGGDHDEDSKPGRNVIYTDRPIYRPGDWVQFKGVVRELVDGEFKLPKSGTSEVTVTDPDDVEIAKIPVQVSAHGTYAGRFRVNREAKPGGYRISSDAGSVSGEHYVAVASYRKPQFTLTIKPTKDHFILGDKASALLTCKYYFGSPVAGAEISASIVRNPIWTDYDVDGEAGDPDEANEATESESGGGGEFLADVKVTTDSRGQALIEFDTNQNPVGQRGDNDRRPQDYTYTINVFASENEDSESITGHGDVLVTRADVQVRAMPTAFISSAANPANVRVSVKSVDGGKPVARQTVHAVFGKTTWSNDESQFKPLGELTAATDDQGVVEIKRPANVKGSVTVRVDTQDSAGRKTTAECWIWDDADGAPTGKDVSMQIVLDKPKYAVGDVAHAIITSNQPGGSVWLTTEAESLITSQVVPLNDKQVKVDIPVTRALAPNCFVNVSYVCEKKFVTATRQLVVDRGDRKLGVKVTTDRKQVQPGESVDVHIVTTDQKGHPVPSELSLSVVDESIYAIKADRTNLLTDFYPRRINAVRTSFSFPEIYLDGGDKGGANVAVRTKFMDTAFWADAITTGADGTANVKVKLPDNLTEWRFTAIGVTDATAVGMDRAKIIAKKPVMVRLNLPRFLVQGDEIETSITFHNDSGSTQKMHASLELTGLSTKASKRIDFELKDGELNRVPITIHADRAGAAALQAKVWTDAGPSDGVQQSFDVSPHGRKLVDEWGAGLRSVAKTDLNLRSTADKNVGSLVVTVSPSIGAAILKSAESLIGYPYGCVEQTMSKFLPSVLVDDLLTKTGRSNEKLHEKTKEIAADGLARLQKMRHEDGAWGWWEHDSSDVFMTSLVLDGLYRAKKLGYAEDLDTDRALAWLKRQLEANEEPNRSKFQYIVPTPVAHKAYAAYVLTLYGNKAASIEFLKRVNTDNWTAEPLAYLALTAHAVGDKAHEEAFLKRINAQRQGDNDTAYWLSDYGQPSAQESAIALRALQICAPTSPSIPMALRYIMQTRRADGWHTTLETSTVVQVLTDYLNQTKEMSAPKSVVVKVNGREVGRRSWDAGAIDDYKVELPVSALESGSNRLEIVAGDGSVYAGARLTQYDVRDELPQVVNDSKVDVKRTYHLLEVRRMEDGRSRLVPSEKPITEAKDGDVIDCQLKIRSMGDLSYVIVEDPIPSNCRVVEREDTEFYEWRYAWGGIQIMDDRVGLFFRNLKWDGEVIHYTLRAEAPGKIRALPTRVEAMYEPRRWGSSAENPLEIVK